LKRRGPFITLQQGFSPRKAGRLFTLALLRVVTTEVDHRVNLGLQDLMLARDLNTCSVVLMAWSKSPSSR
jgi:hypothetical protein